MPTHRQEANTPVIDILAAENVAAPALRVRGQSNADGARLIDVHHLGAGNAMFLQDSPATEGSTVSIEHYADGSGSTTQTYGLEIHNNDGARSALVIHQYSNVSEAIIIDNTDTKSAIRVHNTQNLTRNPDGDGTGKMIEFVDHGNTRSYISGDGRLVLTGPTAGTWIPIDVQHNAASVGPRITSASTAAGFYALQVIGYDYGPQFSTSQNSGDTLTVDKQATGAGTALKVKNAGTGISLSVQSSSTELWSVTAAGLPKWTAAGNQQTTVGAAGGASALPATPTKYLKIVDSAGTTLVVPAYAAS